MQLPHQEHPKHTHDVLRVLPPSSTITAVKSLIFLLTCHKKIASNQSCTSIREWQLTAFNTLRYPGTWLYATPSACPKQKLAFWPSVYNLSQTSRSSYLSPTSWNTPALQFISRHPSHARSSESFWSHFYYISLELPLPSSPQKISMGDYILTSINS